MLTDFWVKRGQYHADRNLCGRQYSAVQCSATHTAMGHDSCCVILRSEGSLKPSTQNTQKHSPGSAHCGNGLQRSRRFGTREVRGTTAVSGNLNKRGAIGQQTPHPRFHRHSARHVQHAPAAAAAAAAPSPWASRIACRPLQQLVASLLACQ